MQLWDRFWKKHRSQNVEPSVQMGDYEFKQALEKLGVQQRALADRAGRLFVASENKLTAITERMRVWRGERGEYLKLQAEQKVVLRMLDRLELAELGTSELLQEWRDWLRAWRQGLAVNDERAELLRSELRLRGVIQDEQAPVISHQEVDLELVESRHAKEADLFSEWDQYFGQHLPKTAIFWMQRFQAAQTQGVEDKIIYGLVKQMRKVHGAANIWRRMQERVEF